MKVRKIATPLGSLLLVLLLAMFFPAVANASTISVGDGVISTVGSTTTVNITLDGAPDGLSGYKITVSLSDPNVAEITGVEFPSWATMNDNSALPADSFWMKAVDLNQQVEAGATDVDLGTLTIRGDANGECEINVAIDRVDDDSGDPINPSVNSGTLAVEQYHLTPDISVSPTWKDFGDITVGSSSSVQTITVYNDGTADLHVGTIGIGGIDAGQFSKQNYNYSGETIAPGGSATLEVVFSPTSTGGQFAELSISSDDPDEATVTVSLSGAGVVGPPSTVTLTADPINLLADGASTSMLTATVKDAEGHNVVDGTPVSFTTDLGVLGSSTITKTTTNGAVTATFTAPIERGIATVRAQADRVSDYTAVFFKEPGQPDVVAAKTESTGIGIYTVDAKGEANTTVTKSGVGTPTITVARYEENPGSPSITAFAGGYIAVQLDDTTNVDEVTICLYYPITVDESEVRLYWWDEATSAWVLTSAQTKDTSDIDGYGGKVCITVRATGTIPTLVDLQGTVFLAGGDGSD